MRVTFDTNPKQPPRSSLQQVPSGAGGAADSWERLCGGHHLRGRRRDRPQPRRHEMVFRKRRTF